MECFWSQHALTGDNVRERPYANLHALLTTKSNSFTVFVRAESIEKAEGSAPDVFSPGEDTITESWSGRGRVERFLDLQDPALVDSVREVARGREPAPLTNFYQLQLSLEEPDAVFQIRDVVLHQARDPKDWKLTVTWNSRPGEYYGVETTDDYSTWERIDETRELERTGRYRGVVARGWQTAYTLSAESVRAVRVTRR